ncbi:MAG: hypothetical protein VX955_06260, partial [Pseudomonadota bacterium]|nr:hypothetical protein [Pseudomonadota bacterium]
AGFGSLYTLNSGGSWRATFDGIRVPIRVTWIKRFNLSCFDGLENTGSVSEPAFDHTELANYWPNAVGF